MEHLKQLAKALHLQICKPYKEGRLCRKYNVKKITSEHIDTV